MRTLRPLAALAAVLVVTACTSAKPGWTYAPAPSPTPLPSVEASASASAAPPSASAPASASASGPAASAPAGGTVLELEAQGVKFNTAELSAPADQPFQIHFVNNDASIPHNVAIHEGSPTGPEKFKGEIFPGPGERTYDVPALAAGPYAFVCTVHPNMTGTLTVQ
jgi:plastocyanin